MTKAQFAVLATLLAIVALLTAAPILFPDRTSPAWEYKIESIADAKFVPEINASGAAGWELVFARRAMGDGAAAYELIYKRPK